MEPDTTNATSTETPRFYYFSYKLVNDGVFESALTEQETRDKLNRELAAVYGPDGVTVTEMREATETEVDYFKQLMAERFGLDLPETTNEPTIN